MALLDFLRPRKKKPALMKREYSAANVSRLFNDFKDSNRSADSELQPVMRRLRNRSRDLARNNEYVKRYLYLLKTNVIGDRGFTLQVKAQNATGMLDEIGNQAVEGSFRAWGKVGRCTVDGKLSWIDAQKMAIEGLARDGEVFIVKHRNAAFRVSSSISSVVQWRTTCLVIIPVITIMRLAPLVQSTFEYRLTESSTSSCPSGLGRRGANRGQLGRYRHSSSWQVSEKPL